MTSAGSFARWLAEAAGVTPPPALQLDEAFAVAVCRIEEAARMNARDPVRALSNTASYGSRATTKSMFGQLGYTPAQVRIVQRVLAGSDGGWPGLIRLYLSGAVLTRDQRSYLRRQLRQFAIKAGSAA